MKQAAIVLVLTLMSKNVLLLENHHIVDLFQGKWVELGPVDASFTVGSLPEAYPELYEDDRRASYAAMQSLPLLTRMLGVGIHTLPPLDPYIKTDLAPFAITFPILKGAVKVNKLKAVGARSLNVNELTLRLHYDDLARVDYNLTIPRLEIEVDFTLDAYIENIIPVNFDGRVEAVVTDFEGTGAQAIGPLEGDKDRAVVLGYKGYGKMKNLELRVDLHETILKLLEDSSMVISSVYSLLKDVISEKIGELIIEQENEVLSGVTIPQLKAFLTIDE